MTKAPQGKIITKKHLARVERERMQTRMILIGSAIALALVVLLIGYGILDQTVFQPNRPVAKVNGESISLKEFQGVVRYNRLQVIQYYNYLAQIFQGDQTYLSQYQTQVQSELGAAGQTTLDALIEDRLIRQEAKRRGITVSKEEVDRAFQEAQNYFRNGTPTPKPTLEPIPTSTLSAFQMTALPPTATATPTLVPPTPTAITATTGISGTSGVTVTAPLSTTTTPAITETNAVVTPTLAPTPLPTATPYTEDLYNQKLKELFANYQGVGISDAQLRRIVESGLYRQKVQEAVVAEMQIDRTEDQVWARHILIKVPETTPITGTLSVSNTIPLTVTQIMEELQNGADFAELAAKYSQDESNAANGGDLGWFGKGKMVAEFESAVWNLQVGEIVSAPVKTQYGYHIIQVLGHEKRPMSDSDYEQLQQTKFTEWLATKRTEAKIETYDEFWMANVPTSPSLEDQTQP